jgi:L-cysteine S-thiosulfotransferase
VIGRRLRVGAGLVIALLLTVGHSARAVEAPAPRSGYEFLSPENRALQDDTFANPGMLWVEAGGRRFAADCSGCHKVEQMRDAGLRYPAFDERTGRLINLEQRINRCQTEQLRRDALAWESEALLSLTTWIAHQAQGRPIQPVVDARTQPFLEAGRAFFEARRGQLDLACAHCHDRHAGQRLRGEVVSEGHINGYPAYRQVWETLGSTHRLFRWCNEAVRAEPYPFGAEEYVNLEYYLNWRGNGLTVETPAVRR